MKPLPTALFLALLVVSATTGSYTVYSNTVASKSFCEGMLDLEESDEPTPTFQRAELAERLKKTRTVR